MSRIYKGFLAGAAALIAVTACSASASVRQTTAARQATAAKPVEVLSVSFVSPRVGYLLGERGEQASRVLMRKTVNGGRTWAAVHAPAAPAADMFQSSPPPGAVGSVYFSSESDGWAFGPALWRTTDGGATWRRERAPGPVTGFAVASGRMLTVITRTDKSGTASLRLYAARAGTDDWQAVPGAAVSDVSGASLAVSGRTGYLLASRHDLAGPVLLAGPVSRTGLARLESEASR